MSNWQKVYEDTMEYRASIVRDILDEHELDPVLVNKKDTNYHMGAFEVHVAPDHVIKAIKIIEDKIDFK